jgi:hypothetical protein
MGVNGTEEILPLMPTFHGADIFSPGLAGNSAPTERMSMFRTLRPIAAIQPRISVCQNSLLRRVAAVRVGMVKVP